MAISGVPNVTYVLEMGYAVCVGKGTILRTLQLARELGRLRDMVDTPKPKRRSYGLTPDRISVGLVAVVGLLVTSEQFGWFGLDEKKGWPVLIAAGIVGLAILLGLLCFVASLLLRWRFQFSIRSLLLLTVAVAILCSWFVVRMRQVERQRGAVDAMKAAGLEVSYRKKSRSLTSEALGPAALRDRLGVEFFSDVDTVEPASAKSDPFSTTASPRAQQFSDDDVALLIKGSPKVRRLVLSKTQVTDAGLVHLKRFHKLEDLELEHTQVTDAGLQHLKGLVTLQILYLNDTQVTDAGLVHLKGLTRLRYLSLDHTRVGSTGLRHLEALPDLKTLRLCGTEVTDAGLEHLGGLKKLDGLILDDTQVTDAGLKHLGGLKELTVLSLRHTGVTDAGLEHVQGLTELVYLNLRDTSVTDTGLQHLAGLTNLEMLFLDKTHLSDAGLEHLSGLKKLRVLTCNSTQVTDVSLEHLKGLTNLETLVVPSEGITDAGAKELQQALPKCQIHR